MKVKNDDLTAIESNTDLGLSLFLVPITHNHAYKVKQQGLLAIAANCIFQNVFSFVRSSLLPRHGLRSIEVKYVKYFRTGINWVARFDLLIESKSPF